MVKSVGKHYICEECKLKYNNRTIAQKCEKWCKKHKSCNLEIIEHAINDKVL